MSYDVDNRVCECCDSPWQKTAERELITLPPRFLICRVCWLLQDEPDEDGVTPDEWRADLAERMQAAAARIYARRTADPEWLRVPEEVLTQMQDPVTIVHTETGVTA